MSLYHTDKERILNYTEPVLENQITQKVKSELQRAWRDSILIDEKRMDVG